ncbi:AAA family ATPase [Pseudomonas aeruginosa]|uniref:AAA family ATPase n=1 Tax=Pseudomonas aeruginosa TaxID=287 RepID=UPI0009A559AC|nr:ATP-binding protein [Pseudomonas aeruginosa]
MKVVRLKLKNWLNFREVDVPLTDRCYLLGPNAAGKSNFLDVFRFLRDVAKTNGGGLQKAVNDRGGIKKLRCLQARRDPVVRIEVHLEDNQTKWEYALAFQSEGKGAQKLVVIEESVVKDNMVLVIRPDKHDVQDGLRLTQTYLEQINANQSFRPLSEFFSATTYLHLVPQLLRFGEKIAIRAMEDDPFGQGFLERLAKTQDRTRVSRLKRIEKTLTAALPQFRELQFIKDEAGKPHLQARYEHWRPNAGWQTEEQFSDGTLRLIGLLWSMMDGDNLLLLEEPELSLSDAIVEKIPLMIDRIQKQSKQRRQVLISTHSEALLKSPIDANGVLLLEPTDKGTRVRQPDSAEKKMLDCGLTVAEVILPKARPQLTLQGTLFD